MIKPLDEMYLEWLYSQVGDTSYANPTHTYWNLLKKLSTKPFVCIVERDTNRVEDGLELRERFLRESRVTGPDVQAWMELPCSVLEVMVALSERLAFEGDGEAYEWFWEMVRNLGLDDYNDRRRFSNRRVDETLDRFINREYEYNGHGGLFPLYDAKEDQRKVELRYQQAAYLLERMS